MLQDLINEDTRGPGFPASYKYDGLLRELAALLVPHIVEHPDMQKLLGSASQLVTRETVEEIVQAKIDDLGPMDRDMIREVCEEVIDASDIDDKINDYMSSNFEISDYESEIKDMVDVDDAIENYLITHLDDQVTQAVQGLTFNVEVSSR